MNKRVEKRKALFNWFLKTFLIRVQVLCVSVGGLWLIFGLDMIDKSIMYVPMGLILLCITMAMLVPIPHWWELEAGKEREKWYGDDFKDGLDL